MLPWNRRQMATSSYSQANLCIFQSSLLKEFFTISIINVYNESRLFSLTILYNSGPQTFQHQVPILWEIIFLQTGVGDGLGMIQVHYIYCALYFYYYYISSTSDHQTFYQPSFYPDPFILSKQFMKQNMQIINYFNQWIKIAFIISILSQDLFLMF